MYYPCLNIYRSDIIPYFHWWKSGRCMMQGFDWENRWNPWFSFLEWTRKPPFHYTGVLPALEALERILQCLFGSFPIQCAFSELQKVTTREGREGEESASLNKYKTSHCLVINRSSGQGTWWQELGSRSVVNSPMGNSAVLEYITCWSASYDFK